MKRRGNHQNKGDKNQILLMNKFEGLPIQSVSQATSIRARDEDECTPAQRLQSRKSSKKKKKKRENKI